jgi:NAD(P)-dependent dehydrogenase (short-subunit alcohol dehydrogenase family)
MAARQLALMIPAFRTGVVVNVVSPGLCNTELARNGPPEFQAIMAKRVVQYGRTAEVGSRTLLHAALAGKESHGHFLDSCEVAE